uniref:RNA transcription, translation and transport factor protein n=1 Tax=Canis lupus familiaris TaxID=9615 RepID=A0A8C0Q1D2_CANLF
MFRRKLTALDYHNPAGFNCKDETEFRNFIVWLEDQKIRHYKIEDRGNLRNIHSSDWPKFFEKYLRDVNCPFKIQDRQEAIDWLLGLAVRLEYGDNAEKYKDLVPDNTKNADNAAKNAEPLINLDVNNPDFKAGVMALANLLQIQRHDDYLVMLKVSCIFLILDRNSLCRRKTSVSKNYLYVDIWLMTEILRNVRLKADFMTSSVLDYLVTTNMKVFTLCLPLSSILGKDDLIQS